MVTFRQLLIQLELNAQLIRSSAIEQGVPLFTALDTAKAMLTVLESRCFNIEAI